MSRKDFDKFIHNHSYGRGGRESDLEARIAALEAAANMVIDDALDMSKQSDPPHVTWASVNALRRAMGYLKGAKP